MATCTAPAAWSTEPAAEARGPALHMTTPPPPDGPDRIALLDIVRGFALPGILLMNIEWFTRWPGKLGQPIAADVGGADYLAAWLIHVLVQGKFWVMFSLLFGAGFAVMQQRADAIGRPFVAPYLRRAGFLFVLGLAHALLLWVGDILHTYALAALGLLLFRRVEPLWRGVAGAMIFLLPTVMMAGTTATYLLVPELGGPPTLGEDPLFAQQAADAARIYGTGDWLAVTGQRARDVLDNASSEVFMVPVALGIFLMGSWLLASGRWSRPHEHVGFHRAMAFGVGPAGLAACAWAATLATGFGPEATDAEMLAQLLSWVGAPLLTLGYVGALALLSLRPAAGGFLRRWLAPAGRMALTNYLMASLICTTIFYGYGFALWGQVSRSAQVGLVLAILVLQSLLSRWWLGRFRYGPLEWLWRAFTWLQWPAMRR